MATKNKNFTYCDLVNFKDTSYSNPQQLWRTPMQIKSRMVQHKSTASRIEIPQSSLLQSALTRIQYDREKFQQEAVSDLLSQESSNFIFSRENTPANFSFPKRKNKHKTAGSDLFDIESKGSDHKKDDHDMFEGLVLYPHLIGMSDVVYAEAVGREKKVNGKLINNWKDCLMPEDKQQIYGNNAPYTFSRIFPVNQLEKGINQIYGSGKRRCLRLGEQSLLIHHMGKYLQKCTNEVTKIARKDYDIINDVLRAAKLQQLEHLPVCMKQVQLFWKILATQWRYSGKLDSKNKLLESALINGKSNFVDLKKDNGVTRFLLAYSNIAENRDEIH